MGEILSTMMFTRSVRDSPFRNTTGVGIGRSGQDLGYGLPRPAEQHLRVSSALSTNDALQRYPDEIHQGPC